MKKYYLTESQMEEVIEIAKRAYASPQKHHTSVYLVGEEIIELNSVCRSTILQKYDICLLFITSDDTYQYQNMLREEMSVEQIEHCNEKGWLAIDVCSSDAPKDWEEFTIEDDMDFNSSIEKIVQSNIQLRNKELEETEFCID